MKDFRRLLLLATLDFGSSSDYQWTGDSVKVLLDSEPAVETKTSFGFKTSGTDVVTNFKV